MFQTKQKSNTNINAGPAAYLLDQFCSKYRTGRSTFYCIQRTVKEKSKVDLNPSYKSSVLASSGCPFSTFPRLNSRSQEPRNLQFDIHPGTSWIGQNLPHCQTDKEPLHHKASSAEMIKMITLFPSASWIVSFWLGLLCLSICKLGLTRELVHTIVCRIFPNHTISSSFPACKYECQF